MALAASFLRPHARPLPRLYFCFATQFSEDALNNESLKPLLPSQSCG
jgi:hypothetical protein